MTHFDDLPEEIVLKVFSYIPQSYLQTVVLGVCHKWRRISRDTSLYSRLGFDSELSLVKAIDLTSTYSPYVTQLVISHRPDTNEILKYVPICENLTSLTVNSCSGFTCRYSSQVASEVNADLISLITEKNSKLNFLGIAYSMVKNRGIRICGNSLEKLVLKNVYYHRSVEEDGLLRLRKLKVLNLQRLIVNKSVLREVILNNSQTLQTLKLDVWEPQLGSNDTVVEAVSSCHNLKKLLIRNLSFYRLSDHSFHRLTRLRSLTTVKFSKIDNVNAKTFVSLFQQQQSENFTNVYLSSCDNVDRTVIRAIADSCPRLVKFTLHQPRATAENTVRGKYLLYLSTKCVRLQLLDLCCTHSSVGNVLPRIVENLPDLRHFKYSKNGSGSASTIGCLGSESPGTGCCDNDLRTNVFRNFSLIVLDETVLGSRVKN